MAPKPCIDCQVAPKRPPRHRCDWCWLMTQPIETQVRAADRRRSRAEAVDGFVSRARVPESEWPEGRRWCSGCQSMVPLRYCRGRSRCNACESRAKHASHLARTYQGIDEALYQKLGDWQSWRCYLCGRRVHSKRLAVDHDHETGEVRGLLCADDAHGCNKAILGNVTGLSMARRIAAYYEKYPLRRMLDGEPRPVLAYREESRALLQAATPIDPNDDPPPF